MTITIVEGRRAGLTLPAAMVLSQLSFWHPKAKARHGEKTWWAKTHTEISALSGVSVHQVRRGLTELKKRGLSILLSEQNVGFARLVSDRAYMLEKGQICWQGTMAQLADDTEVQRAYLTL